MRTSEFIFFLILIWLLSLASNVMGSRLQKEIDDLKTEIKSK